jgi:hypothetical protein
VIRQSSALATLLLALAIFPQITFLDYFVAEAIGKSVAPSESPADHAGHLQHEQLHCHGDLGSCSEVPLTAGPGQLLAMSQFEPGSGIVIATQVAAVDEKLPGLSVPPLRRPPQI